MALASDSFKLQNSYFHAVSKVNSSGLPQYPFESLYKASHTIVDKDVWVDEVGYCTTEAEADAFVLANPDKVKKYTQVPLTMVPGSNGLAWYLDDGGKFVRPIIVPTDIPNTVSNLPSQGFQPKFYKADNAFIPMTTGVYQLISDAGIIVMQSGYTPADLGWGIPKITCYVYVGRNVRDVLSGVMQGTTWLSPVISKTITEAPSGNNGDRYIVPVGATGVWAGKTDQIATYNSSTSAWIYQIPVKSWTTFVLDEALIYNYNGTAWVQIGGSANAANVYTDVSTFNNVLSPADINVQLALNTLNNVINDAGRNTTQTLSSEEILTTIETVSGDLTNLINNIQDNDTLDIVALRGNTTGVAITVGGLTSTGTVDVSGNYITNVPLPILGSDAVNKDYVDTLVAVASGANWKVYIDQQDSITLDQANTYTDMVSGDIVALINNNNQLSEILTNGNDAGAIPITNLGDPSAPKDATNKEYVDNLVATSSGDLISYIDTQDQSILAEANTYTDRASGELLNLINSLQDSDTLDIVTTRGNTTTNQITVGGITSTAIIDASGNYIINVATPLLGTDAVNKDYVDTLVDSFSGDLVTYIDEQDSLTLSEANTYTNIVSGGIINYVNTQDEIVLLEAQAYTDMVSGDIIAHIQQSNELFEILLNGNDAGGLQIKNLGEPTDSKDATTKNYVDNLVQSFSGDLVNYIDEQDQLILTDALTYTDIVSGDLVNQITQGDTATLEEANTYTDNVSGDLVQLINSIQEKDTLEDVTNRGNITDNEIVVGGIVTTGTINVSGNYITNVPLPINGNDAVNKEYVDTLISSASGTLDTLQNVTSRGATTTIAITVGGLTSDGVIDVQNNSIINVPTPIDNTDAVNKEYVDTLVSTISGGGESLYSGVAERTVGGITDGQAFTNSTMIQMWDSLIKQEKFPTLTAPSSAFTSSITGLREVGEIVNLTFNSTFSGGAISPQYTAASPYRSGVPNTYQFTGTGLTNQSKSDLSDSQVVNSYTVLINAQNWQGRVAYDAGVQPKSSYDNDYSTPLIAGTTGYVTRTITGVYPFFGTTVGITTQTKQPLSVHNATYWQLDMVAEGGTDKQKGWFSSSHSVITGVQFYNTVSGQWEWLGGSKANSLLAWTTTVEQIDVQGTPVDYTRYTHSGALVGARQLRFYTN